MSFVFPVLLGGLTLIGVPILLHLIMRQKPKHLLFPAFRFLLQRHRTNQRKLQLRHLLLLALRLLLVAGVCLALARHKLFSSRLNLSGERPIAAVLVFDTSFSMGYVSGGKDRLETARQRALELLAELPEGSRVAVLDTAEPGGEWLPTLSLARDRIGDLKLRPANSPVTTRLAEAYRLLADLDQETESGDDALPKFLYIFSDRTQDSWDQSRVKDLQQLRDRLATEAHAVLVDVGVDKPVDLALVAVEMPRQVVPTDDTAQLKVTVRSTGERVDTEVVCRIDGKAAEHKPIQLDAGQSRVVVFERRDLPTGFHQAEITLATNDALPFNNAQFATFEVRGGRRVLALVDDPNDAAAWRTVFDVSKEFRCEVHTVTEARRLSPTEDLAKYQAICLLNVASPEHDLWQKLKSYVDKGGGLAIAPGSDLDLKAYNGDPIARELLPGRLVKVVQAEKKKDEKEARASWKEATYQHPVMAPFKDWSTDPSIDFLQFPPAAFRYWEVEPSPKPDSYVIVSYDDK
ncbi:MAG TPA: BatA domain-containing protein, partial [Gemmataceae bacterium]|nr:BatA domain-containing protein [Gemmataceae bacterium]